MADAGLAAGGGEPGARERARLPVALNAGEQELLDQVIGYDHETLLGSAEGLGPLWSHEWWNRGESNPRPQAFAGRFYMRSCLIWI